MIDRAVTYNIPAHLVDDIMDEVELQMFYDGFDVEAPTVRRHIERMRARLDQSTMTFHYVEVVGEDG